MIILRRLAGIERADELETCLELGFVLIQGFLFGRGEAPFASVTLPERR